LIGMSKARESAIVGRERFIIRPAADDDIKEMSGVLRRAGLSSYRPEILEFSVADPAPCDRLATHESAEVPMAVPYSERAIDAPAAPASSAGSAPHTGTQRVKRGMADMLKGGVIMDVVTPDQAKIAEDAGAVAVMALERVPADIRAQGGVARMSDPDMIDSIIAAVSVPVMAKCRIGHFAEAQVLQAIGVDYIDESEVLTPADEAHHVDKWEFTVPFVCGATSLGEALRRIGEGAAMIRSKGEAGTGNVVEATRHMRAIRDQIGGLSALAREELFTAAKDLAAPYELVAEVAAAGQLPVVLFTAGGIATPADAAMMMQLGADGVFVGSGIFKSGDPAARAAAIVKATTFHDDPDVIAKVSRGLGEPMVGISLDTLAPEQRYAGRGW
jgi:pyridoxal 5'-phosphate synthase pdxS subunit